MAETKRLRITHVRDRVDTPTDYNVIIHNDDETTMDFVVYVLVHIFFKSLDDAEKLMLTVHNSGSAVVGTYPYDIAVSKVKKTLELARGYGFPLNVTCEKNLSF